MAGIRDDVGSEAADSPAFMCEENYGGNEQKTQRLEYKRERVHVILRPGLLFSLKCCP